MSVQADNYESAIKHIMAHWNSQPDRANLAINPEFLVDMMAYCESGHRINPEYMTASHDIIWSGQPIPPKSKPIFIELETEQ